MSEGDLLHLLVAPPLCPSTGKSRVALGASEAGKDPAPQHEMQMGYNYKAPVVVSLVSLSEECELEEGGTGGSRALWRSVAFRHSAIMAGKWTLGPHFCLHG